MKKFDGLDFYNIDAHLSDEERAVRDLVRQWVDDKIIPIIEEHCRAGTFPMELVSEIGWLDGLRACLQISSSICIAGFVLRTRQS